MMHRPEQFDSHLGLERADLEACRAVIFHGASGSGKSTYIANLLDTHSAFRGLDRTVVSGGPIDWARAERQPASLVIVDEMLVLRDLWHVARLLCAGHKVIAASHLSPHISACLGALWPLRQFATDREPAKIERFLTHRGVRFSSSVVTEYCRAYGATYTDAEIILEHSGGDDFDLAYRRFTSRCRIDLVRPHRAWF